MARVLGEIFPVSHINGLVQDCSISSALAMEILQPCSKPSIYSTPQELCTQCAFVLVWSKLISPIFFRVTSLALGQSYVCSNVYWQSMGCYLWIQVRSLFLTVFIVLLLIQSDMILDHVIERPCFMIYYIILMYSYDIEYSCTILVSPTRWLSPQQYFRVNGKLPLAIA